MHGYFIKNLANKAVTENFNTVKHTSHGFQSITMVAKLIAQEKISDDIKIYILQFFFLSDQDIIERLEVFNTKGISNIVIVKER